MVSTNNISNLAALAEIYPGISRHSVPQREITLTVYHICKAIKLIYCLIWYMWCPSSVSSQPTRNPFILFEFCLGHFSTSWRTIVNSVDEIYSSSFPLI